MVIPFRIYWCRGVSFLDFLHACVHIHGARLMRPRILPVNDPVREIDHEEERDSDIRSHESADGPPIRPEVVEPVYEGEEDEESDGEVGAVWLQE